MSHRRRYSEYEIHMRALYRKYKDYCLEANVPLPPYDAFKQHAEREITEEVVERQRQIMVNSGRANEMIYIATPTKLRAKPHVNSLTRPCGQCGQDVWIDVRQQDMVTMAKAIICTQCLPEVSGKTQRQAIEETMSRIFPRAKH